MMVLPSAFLETKRWWYERQRHEYRGAEGCRVWGGGVPFPTGEVVWGGGCAPSPEKFFILKLKIASF